MPHGRGQGRYVEGIQEKDSLWKMQAWVRRMMVMQMLMQKRAWTRVIKPWSFKPLPYTVLHP
jgi:hypothetical protein